jgi:hypothetical protein
MATDDDLQAAEAAEFQKKLDTMVTVTAAVKKSMTPLAFGSSPPPRSWRRRSTWQP